MTAAGSRFLPYGRQLIETDDIEAVAAALKSDWLTTGPLVAKFEAALTELTGGQFAVACSNGTAALHLAALALGLGAGDAVIVPSLTFLATANAARYVGAEVVFADVDPDTGLLRADDVEAALARVPAGLKPRAVFPVHLRGAVCDLDALAQVAARHGLAIVEDAAHAVGSRSLVGGGMQAVGAGTHSAMTCFSFHPVKTIAMGEGGAVMTNDAHLAERLRRMRSHGMVMDSGAWTERDQAFDGGVANPWYYEMPEPGFNYRLTDIQCALGLSQMTKLSRFIARRTALAHSYDRLITKLANPSIRPHAWNQEQLDPAWHLYSARIDFATLGVARGEVMRRLRAQGVGTQVHYIPVHRQPYYAKRSATPALPGADAYYARTLSLPLFPAMSDEDPERVVSALANAVRSSG